jgi:pilus assembly protein CpaB
MKMRWAIVGLIALGVLAATCAALLVASFSSGAKGSNDSSQVDVIIASRALGAFSQIDASCVSIKTVEKKDAPEAYFSNAVHVVGRSLLMPVAEGQVLTPECFGDRDSGARLAATIPPDKVAVNISLADASSIENLLYPGCSVDVIFTSRPTEQKEQPMTKTIFQSVLVLAIDQYSIVSPKHEGDHYTQLGRGEGRRVTLLLNPTQAKELQLAQSIGSISLALRNPGNRLSSDSGPISGDGFMGRKNPTPGPVFMPTSGPSVESWEMEMIKSGQREQRSFPMPGTTRGR